MANLSDFMPYVMPYAAGCSSPLAEQHVRDICIDFCAHSGIVQVAVDPISARPSVTDYDIYTPTGTVTHLILEAWYEGRPLAQFKIGDRIGRPELYNTAFTGASQAGGTPSALKQGPDNTFKIDVAPAVTSANAITLLVSTKPTRKAVIVDDLLLSDYAYEIGQGTVARLLRIPGQSFSNPAASMASEQIYQSARTSARIRSEQSFGRTTAHVNPRRFQ